MIFVPLALGVGVLTIAVLSRLGEDDAPVHGPSAQPRVLRAAASPLRTAFPHLNLWIPSGEFQHPQAGIDQGSEGGRRGSGGPDIIIGSWPDGARQRGHSADAA